MALAVPVEAVPHLVRVWRGPFGEEYSVTVMATGGQACRARCISGSTVVRSQTELSSRKAIVNQTTS